ncbi:hypothetical protein A9Q89_09040 [Gammaproteobacteria bacterium 53_120_T64]|nr:hypothetical protein A9Q89_09040 [Gammaproteobacteria bacterium 53_120_T64]
MNNKDLVLLVTAVLVSAFVNAKDKHGEQPQQVADQLIAQQREALAVQTKNQGYGPQSPRDLNAISGANPIIFSPAPAYTQMNLCNIHFHKNAEHRGGEFTQYAGNGDGAGYQGGYLYTGQLSAADLQPVDQPVCPSQHGGLAPGDTIEVHYVHSTAAVGPGPTLGACLSDAIGNPQLRVETQVYVLANNNKALDFGVLSQHGMTGGFHQALHIPANTGVPVQYAGSTTGPGYNEKGSPLQVTWRVRPKVATVDINSLGTWCTDNVFNEDHAHGVRNLVLNPDLLSPITP